jgi:hypothetical protein
MLIIFSQLRKHGKSHSSRYWESAIQLCDQRRCYADSILRAHGRPPKSCLKSKGVPEANTKILTDAIRKTLQESKLQENLKSRGYNIDLRTTTADLNKLVKEEVDKYAQVYAARPRLEGAVARERIRLAVHQ